MNDKQKDHPCFRSAREITELNEASPAWREHWRHTLTVNGTVKFTGSYDACLQARWAFAAEPYEITDITGKALVSNR